MPQASDTKITSVLQENRRFAPAAAFSAQAHIKSAEHYRAMWLHSKDQPEKFWGEAARELLDWSTPFEHVLEWNPPKAKWFLGGELNASYNCIDRHLNSWRRNKAAIIWEGEPGDTRVLTYQDLHREVCRLANGLKQLGIKKGDRVTIYLPLVPELAIATLACARIGATHSVIFGGFSSEAIAERNRDAGAKLVITADGGWRRQSIVPLKQNVDAALDKSPSVQNVIVLRRTHNDINMQRGRDIWWHELVHSQANHCAAEPVESEHPLFILYTSGSTGKPKGLVHTTAGYLVGAALSSRCVLDLRDDDTYWCTADIGWITGHSYVVYGPLSLGATVVMYEGAPNTPDWGRFWHIIEKYRVSILYTAPTAIRSFMRVGDEWPNKYDLSSLRLLGSVGEPINPEAWIWYRQVIGHERCPIIDTWWQTETGSIMISPLPGVTHTTPGSASIPFFGVVPDIVDKDGKSANTDEGGFLVLKQPWPSMARTIWGDDARYAQTYFSQYPGIYFTGDGARRDADGNYWILGRIDDVLNVSGHRLSTMEVESALVSHSLVAEAAVVGAPHSVKGEGIHCFVTLESHNKPSDELAEELQAHVVQQIGALARPESIRFTEALPKTRSGKIMRRLLRDIASGRETSGDTSTLEDLSVLAKLRETED